MLLPFLVAGLLSIAPNQLVRGLLPLHKSAVETWFSSNPGFRIAKESDCGDCKEQILSIRRGYDGAWKIIPDYEPYYAIGDFNDDGHTDFAIAVISSKRIKRRFRILVFNGPFNDSIRHKPAFTSDLIDLSGQGLFFGPPRPKPHRLLVGPFESEGILLIPKGDGYIWDLSPNEY